MMKHEGGPVYAGIDTHADTHHVAVIDGHGRPLGDAGPRHGGRLPAGGAVHRPMDAGGQSGRGVHWQLRRGPDPRASRGGICGRRGQPPQQVRPTGPWPFDDHFQMAQDRPSLKVSGGSGIDSACPRATRRAVQAATAASRMSSTATSAPTSPSSPASHNAGVGQQRPAPYGAGPGRLAEVEEPAGKLGEGHFGMHLHHPQRRFPNPLLHLEHFGL